MEKVLVIPEKDWTEIVQKVSRLEHKVYTLEKKPIDIVWISRKQAANLLNCHEQTVTDLAHKGFFEYRKGARKIEFNHQSIKEYLYKTGVR